MPRGRGPGIGRRGRGRGGNPSYRPDLNQESPISAGLKIPTTYGQSTKQPDELQAAASDSGSEQRISSIANGSNKSVPLERQQFKTNSTEEVQLNKPFALPKTASIQETTGPPSYEISINGIPFRVTNGGRRLLRIPSTSNPTLVPNSEVILSTDQSDDTQALPKTTIVAGVTFDRTKNGNYFRRGVINLQKYQHIRSVKGTHLISGRLRNTEISFQRPCAKFTATGKRFVIEFR